MQLHTNKFFRILPPILSTKNEVRCRNITLTLNKLIYVVNKKKRFLKTKMSINNLKFKLNVGTMGFESDVPLLTSASGSLVLRSSHLKIKISK